MGGFGSGRHDGGLVYRVVLDYRNRSAHNNGGEWEPMNYAVWLDWTSCTLGGRRAAGLVAVSCCWLWAARGGATWRARVRVPPVQPAGISQPA